MPSTVSEFEDDTAFERLVLDRATPLLPTAQARSVIDLRQTGHTSVAVQPGTIGARVNIFLSDSAGSPSSPLTVEDLRPLIFGAAWKVLDLLVEVALHSAGICPRDGQRYGIDEKSGKAGGGVVPAVAPFDARADIWLRLMRTYWSTTELRHALVHRQVKINPGTGEMNAVPEQEKPIPQPLTASEQIAFCRTVQGAAEAVISGALSARRRRPLLWVLDQLIAHHKQLPFGAARIEGVIPTVLAGADSVSHDEVAVNVPAIFAKARQAVGGVSFYDLQIYLPDGRILMGALEEAPRRSVTFPVEQPPSWLQWA